MLSPYVASYVGEAVIGTDGRKKARQPVNIQSTNAPFEYESMTVPKDNNIICDNVHMPRDNGQKLHPTLCLFKQFVKLFNKIRSLTTVEQECSMATIIDTGKPTISLTKGAIYEEGDSSNTSGNNFNLDIVGRLPRDYHDWFGKLDN